MSLIKRKLGDVWRVETFDGEILHFSGQYALMEILGLGAPPTQFITRKGYRQHGVTEVDYLLEPRVVSLQVQQDPPTDPTTEGGLRQEYWDNRAALHDYFLPNRGGAATLILLEPDGAERAIDVRAMPGFEFNQPVQGNDWRLAEPIILEAHDPTFYAPAATVISPAQTAAEQLVFESGFPRSFGPAGVQFTTGLIDDDDLGSWRSYPVLTVTGPYNFATLQCVGTGAEIVLQIPIGAGEQRIITTHPDALSVVDAIGDSKESDLGVPSNFVRFYLAPTHEISAPQSIRAVLVDGTVNSAFSVAFHPRYFGI